MKVSNLEITLLPNTPFLNPDGTFNRDQAMDFSGKIGGICYKEAGLMACFNEKKTATDSRIERTTFEEHQSIYEHIGLTLYLNNFSKMGNMVLNNEHQGATSERSLRYTRIKDEDCNLTEREIMLYNKWFKIFYDLFMKKYGKQLDEKSIETHAKENARYMCSVFVNTEMVHTLPFAQLNRIVRYMKDYIEKENKNEFEQRVAQDFEMFIDQCEKLNILDERLQSNRKHRKLSIFGENLDAIPQNLDVTYAINYTGSLAQYAQRERHRVDDVSFERDPSLGFYVPEIIEKNDKLVKEWLNDIESVKEEVPQGENVRIHVESSFKKFIMFLKERDCSHPQLEIFRHADKFKEEYYQALVNQNHPYAKKLKPYMGVRRCGYPTYDCAKPCGFKEGIDGTRVI